MQSEKDRLVTKVISLLDTDKEIVELACNEEYKPGCSVNSRLKEAGFRVMGIDIERGESVNMLADLNKPFPMMDSSIKQLLAMDIIEHLDNPKAFLRECYRVLDNNGTLILTTPNPASIVHFMAATRSISDDIGDRYPHIHYMDKHCFNRMLRPIGFLEIHYELIAAHYNRNVLARIVQWLVPNWRSQILVVAKK